MNRRDCLETLLGSFALPVLEILPLQFMNRNGKVTHGTMVNKSQPIVPLGPCAWARMARQLMDRNENVTLERLHKLMESVMTSLEVNNRLNLTLLPLDLQDEVDAGRMPLVKAIILSHSKNPRALWEKAKNLYPHQIELFIKLNEHYKHGKNAAFVDAYGTGLGKLRPL